MIEPLGGYGAFGLTGHEASSGSALPALVSPNRCIISQVWLSSPSTVWIRTMHSGSPEVAALEARYIREVVGAMTYREALAVFTELWTRAERMNEDFPGPWETDIAWDIELARVLNALPQNS